MILIVSPSNLIPTRSTEPPKSIHHETVIGLAGDTTRYVRWFEAAERRHPREIRERKLNQKTALRMLLLHHAETSKNLLIGHHFATKTTIDLLRVLDEDILYNPMSNLHACIIVIDLSLPQRLAVFEIEYWKKKLAHKLKLPFILVGINADHSLRFIERPLFEAIAKEYEMFAAVEVNSQFDNFTMAAILAVQAHRGEKAVVGMYIKQPQASNTETVSATSQLRLISWPGAAHQLIQRRRILAMEIMLSQTRHYTGTSEIKDRIMAIQIPKINDSAALWDQAFQEYTACRDLLNSVRLKGNGFK